MPGWSCPAGENNKANEERGHSEKQMGVARRSRGSRCVGMDLEATGRTLDLTLSRGVTIRLSFSKDHCLQSEERVKGQGQSKESSARERVHLFHPQHLSHMYAWSHLSPSATAGKGGGQRAPDPTHRSFKFQSHRANKAPGRLLLPRATK